MIQHIIAYNDTFYITGRLMEGKIIGIIESYKVKLKSPILLDKEILILIHVLTFNFINPEGLIKLNSCLSSCPVWPNNLPSLRVVE